ncbi:MAG: YceD family protein [Candidatus Contendobacter sp.]|nr:YceD family protein [Candidatus Contendobacter sp.]
MLTPSLPDKLYPWQLAADNGRLTGDLALDKLPRLMALMNPANGVVRIDLSAGKNGQGLPFITGCLRTEVELTCQRCLGSLRWPLEVAVRLGLVRTEAEAARLPDDYEPLLASPDCAMSVADLVEDELLLALPQIPRHADQRECEAHGYGAPDPAFIAEQRRPFGLLASLLPDSKRSY